MDRYRQVPLWVLEKFKEDIEKQEGRKYPCSNQTVVCGIITDDKELAMEFMKNKTTVKPHISRNDGIMWNLENGERWLWLPNWENRRGYRFYKIALDSLVTQELFNNFVRPCCNIYCCSVEIMR